MTITDGTATTGLTTTGDRPVRNLWTPAVWTLSCGVGLAAIAAVYGLHASRQQIVGWATAVGLLLVGLAMTALAEEYRTNRDGR